jgi:large subunit ribosomal protein L6
MSRIGKKPIDVPAGVGVVIDGAMITVTGPKGELKRAFDGRMKVSREDSRLVVSRSGEDRQARALHGMTRAILANMVTGVSTGFTRQLEIGVESVGYRAEMSGKKLVLYLGYSHPVEMEPPAGIVFAADSKTRTITVSGADKELVGEMAARVRKQRPPEPYKGKGVRYAGEKTRLKPGKAGKTGKGAK